MRDESPATGAGAFAARVNRRINDLRLTYPTIHGVDVDVLFLAYLLEAQRFGRLEFGPVSIDASVVEDLFVRSLPDAPESSPHRMTPSAHAFYGRLASELERAGTRRANELHYLLAFMRSPDGLPARVFGELAVRPEAVERFAKQPRGHVQQESYLTAEEVAVRLSVNVQTVRAWIRSGKLPASRLAGRRVLRIRESDLETVLEPVNPADFD